MIRRVIVVAVLSMWAVSYAAGPYFATGIKIGEVDDTSALVWLRLTREAERVGGDAPVPDVQYRDDTTGELVPRQGRPDMEPVVTFPGGSSIDTIEGAVPGAAGDVTVKYQKAGDAAWTSLPTVAVNPTRDFTAQVGLSGLAPGTAYELEATSSDGATIAGSFRTAPAPEAVADVTFTVTTGTAYPDRDLGDEGFKMYGAMKALDTDFFVHTGDIIYYDPMGKSKALAQWYWARMYSLPSNVEFHRTVPSYFIKDDHDVFMNDCWPGMQTRFMGELTFEQGLDIYRDEVPMGERTYRTYRWGKDLQVWLVEGRDFRSPNHAPDGPSKSIWGVEQKQWLMHGMARSDASFRIVISPTPIVGPDRDKKTDNHANEVYASEGVEVRAFLASLGNAYVICGDRHWQYISVDPVTGLKEFSTGPASDEHAGGWKQEDVRPEHVYLNVIGGFLGVGVSRAGGVPVLTATHYGVDGDVLHEDRNVGTR